MKKPCKILICPDSFKGSMSADTVCDIIGKGVKTVLPEAEIISMPLGDGGEGSISALFNCKGWRLQQCDSHDAIMRKCKAKYLLSKDNQSAFIESSEAIGLYAIPELKRNPLNTTAYGLGEIIKDAIKTGCKNIYIGLGGSATNDCGMGMLRALGFNFFDSEGHELLGYGNDLERVREINNIGVSPLLSDITFYAVCDVDNPLFGENGAAFIYAPQKGATPEEVIMLDNGLKHFSETIKSNLNIPANPMRPGSGAAGGLGFAISSILKGKILKGSEFILNMTGCSKLIAESDMVITGEGSFDRQSFMGKIVGRVVDESNINKVPVIIFSGKVDSSHIEGTEENYVAIEISDHGKTLEYNMKPEVAEMNLFNAVVNYFKDSINL